jgi:serine/threonine protein kinase
MAYLEVRKAGKLVQRRQIDNDKARRGCRIRLGSHESINIKVGETATLDKFEIKLVNDITKHEGDQKPSPNGKSKDILTFSQVSENNPDLPTNKEQHRKTGYPSIDGYEIIDQLGEGGMGTVWRATQLSTKRHVALKLLGNRYFTSKSAQARFEREVSLSAKLTHPNIARIYDSGLHEGIYYYVMELLEGQHLDKYILEEDLDQREVLDLIVKVSMAVEHAHSESIVHRDLKPSNIIVTPDGEPHVLDFGLAKTLEKDSGDITLSIEGQITGTLSYMSPEQAKGDTEAVGEQSDIYSLGVIIYKMLIGTLPHDMEGSRLDVLKRIAEEEIIRPRSVNRKVKRDLEAILLKALALDPQERYATAGGLAMDIKNYLSGANIKARGISPLYLLCNWLTGNYGRIFRLARLIIVSIGAVMAVLFLLDKLQEFQVSMEETIKKQSPESQNQLILDVQEELAAKAELQYQEEAYKMIEQIKKLISDGDWEQAHSKISQFNKDYSGTNASLRYESDLKRWENLARKNIRPQEPNPWRDFITRPNFQGKQRRSYDLTFQGNELPRTQKEHREWEADILIELIDNLVKGGDWINAQSRVKRLEEKYSDTIAYKYHKIRIDNLKTKIKKGLIDLGPIRNRRSFRTENADRE